jgi:hypothetical protein
VMAKRIEIVSFKPDPPNDSVLGISVEITGIVPKYEMIKIFFSEEFMREYFKIPWFKDLPKEQRRVLKENHALFSKWALVKVEERLRTRSHVEEIFIDYEPDAAWAEKVANDTIKLTLRKEKDNIYIYEA